MDNEVSEAWARVRNRMDRLKSAINSLEAYTREPGNGGVVAVLKQAAEKEARQLVPELGRFHAIVKKRNHRQTLVADTADLPALATNDLAKFATEEALKEDQHD